VKQVTSKIPTTAAAASS